MRARVVWKLDLCTFLVLYFRLSAFFPHCLLRLLFSISPFLLLIPFVGYLFLVARNTLAQHILTADGHRLVEATFLDQLPCYAELPREEKVHCCVGVAFLLSFQFDFYFGFLYLCSFFFCVVSYKLLRSTDVTKRFVRIRMPVRWLQKGAVQGGKGGGRAGRGDKQRLGES